MRFIVLVKANRDSEALEAGIMPALDKLEAMGKFNEEMTKAGVMLTADGLQPTSKGSRIRWSSGGKRTVIDGPFAESKELIAGFWIIQAASKQEAIEWISRAPFDDGAEVEIRQIFEAEDFGAALAPEMKRYHERLESVRPLKT